MSGKKGMIPSARGFSWSNGWKHGRMARLDPDAHLLRRGARLLAAKADDRGERAYYLGFARAVVT